MDDELRRLEPLEPEPLERPLDDEDRVEAPRPLALRVLVLPRLPRVLRLLLAERLLELLRPPRLDRDVFGMVLLG